jgi:hypothetical protein
VRPDDLFALTGRSTASNTLRRRLRPRCGGLWLPRALTRRPGPSLAQMVQETRQDTFQSDEGSSA